MRAVGVRRYIGGVSLAGWSFTEAPYILYGSGL